MVLSLHSAALLQAVLLIALFYIHGYWVDLLLRGPAENAWARVPLLGLATNGLALTTLHYLGLPLAWVAWGTLGISIMLDLVVGRGVLRPWPLRDWMIAAVAFGVALFFVLPYALYFAYPFLGDAFMYAGVSDYYRHHAYFDLSGVSDALPWTTMARYAVRVHLAMGAPAVLSGAMALLRVDAPELFIPLSGTFLFTAAAGFWLLADRLFGAGRWGSLIALALYAMNVNLVLMPPALNLLRQTAGLGLFFGFLAFALGKDVIVTGLLLAALAGFYPELVPYASAPLILFFGLECIAGEIDVRSLARRWARVLALSLLANMYGWYAAIQNVLFHWRQRPGFPVKAGIEDYLLHLSNLSMTPLLAQLSSNPVRVVMAAVLLLFSVIGLRRLPARSRVFVFTAAVVYVLVGFYLGLREHYPYGFYKSVQFTFWLLPLGAGAALGALAAHRVFRYVGVAIALCWGLLLAPGIYWFLASAYGVGFDGAYRSLRVPGRMLRSVTAVSQKLSEIDPARKTLLAYPDESTGKWLAYYYRRPVELLFAGEYLDYPRQRPVPQNAAVSYLLTSTSDSDLLDEQKILQRTELFTLSAAQPMVTTVPGGWYGKEFGINGAWQRMGQRAELALYSPVSATVQVNSVVHAEPAAVGSTLRVLLNGQPMQTLPVSAAEQPWFSPDLPLRPGLNTLALESSRGNDAAEPSGLRFEPILFTPPIGRNLSAARMGQQRQLVGLTGDHWTTPAGVSFWLRRTPNQAENLLIQGESKSPHSLIVSADGVQVARLPVPARPFLLRVKLPAGKDLSSFTFVTEQTTVAPRDSRRLGVQIERVAIE